VDNNVKSPDGNPLSEPKVFNLLMQTELGKIEGEKTAVYIRGEIAQSMFVNFKNITDTQRVKLPFGIASVGKAFRNEITPGNFIFRTLEFDLMEFEYFIREKDWQTSFDYWLGEMKAWLGEMGFSTDRTRVREHEKDELSHYSKRTVDIEYSTPFGWKEMFGLAYRTDFDLKAHMENSGQDLRYFDQEANERFIPHVIEPTFGLSRLTLMTMLKEGQPERAKEIWEKLAKRWNVEYDETQSIGKRYRRQDEIGTPFCVTVDFETANDDAVTVRHRDAMTQERVKIAELEAYLAERIEA
jgi:glycyl-tRNA synthetase